MNDITKACIFLEIDGKTYVASLVGVDLVDMCCAIGSTHPNGVLPVSELNGLFQWELLNSDD